jgi:hypothetical protein
LLNGETTEFFRPLNGLRQGDPLSGLLFLIVAEILSQQILENEKISGLKIGNIEVKIDQFADDTKLFLNDKKSLKEALNILKLFEKNSGLKINFDKSEAFWLNIENKNDKPYGLKWTTDPIKCLGIWVSNNIDEMTTLNRTEILNRVDKSINIYKNISMNLYSKIFVINTKILSQINFIATSILIDDDTICTLKKRVLDFLWDGKPPKIKYSTIIGDHFEGGIRMVDIECRIKALQMSWVKNSKGGQTWQNIFKEVNKIGWERVVNFNIDTNRNIKGNFYKNVLRAWQQLFFNETFIDDFLKQPILYNKHLLIGGKHITSFFDDRETIGDVLSGNVKNINANKQLLLHGIKSAIPKNIKDKFIGQNLHVNYGLLRIGSKWKYIGNIKTKEIYRMFIENMIVKPTAITSLEKNLNVQFETNLWQSFFIRTRKYTKNRYFRLLQFKILHGIHNTRKNLKKWNIINSGSCELCLSGDIEGSDHYFLICPFNKNLLTEVHDKISELLKTRIVISDVEFITGLWTIHHNDKYICAIDKILFLTRMFIIKCRRSKIPINTGKFIDFIITQLELEESIKELRPSKIFRHIAWDKIMSKLTE